MGGMFAPKTPALPPAPTPQAPAPMPSSDPNSPALREARRKANADALSRGGRSSTILTAPNDRAGDTYANPKLG